MRAVGILVDSLRIIENHRDLVPFVKTHVAVALRSQRKHKPISISSSSISGVGFLVRASRLSHRWYPEVKHHQPKGRWMQHSEIDNKQQHVHIMKPILLRSHNIVQVHIPPTIESRFWLLAMYNSNFNGPHQRHDFCPSMELAAFAGPSHTQRHSKRRGNIDRWQAT